MKNELTLKSLTIRKLACYEDNAGQFKAEMTWEDGRNQGVTVVLDPAISRVLLEFVAPLLTKFAAESARQIERAIVAAIEDSKPAEVAYQEVTEIVGAMSPPALDERKGEGVPL